MHSQFTGRFRAGPKRVVACIVGAAMFMGCIDGVAPTSTVSVAPPPPQHSYSAEELFRGLVFIRGPVAQLIPGLREKLAEAGTISPDVQRGLDNFESRLLAQIVAEQPGFLDAFAADIRSGDPLRVSAAHRRGAMTAVRALRNMPELVQARAELKKHPEKLAKMRTILHNAGAAALSRQESASSTSAERNAPQGDVSAFRAPTASRSDSVVYRALDMAMANVYTDMGLPDDSLPVNGYFIFHVAIAASALAIVTYVFLGQSYVAVVSAAAALFVYSVKFVYTAPPEPPTLASDPVPLPPAVACCGGGDGPPELIYDIMVRDITNAFAR